MLLSLDTLEAPSVPDKELKKAMLYCFSTAVKEPHGHSNDLDSDKKLEQKVDDYLKSIKDQKGSNLKRNSIMEDYNKLTKNKDYLH